MAARKAAKKTRQAKRVSVPRKAAKARVTRSRVANRTVIKGKRVVVLVKPKMFRAPNGTGYNLDIAGQAKSVVQGGNKGWKVGGKFFATGRGVKKLTSGNRYLDLATGYVYTRRAQNAGRARNISQGFFDANGVFHPIRASVDYDGGTAGETGGKARRTRSKKKRASVVKAARTARERAATRSRKATTTRLATRSLQRSVPLKRTRKRNPNVSPEARAGFESFNGRESKRALTLNFPDGTPQGCYVLGKLKLLKLEGGGKVKPLQPSVYLCADQKQKLHIGTTGERLADCAKGTIGVLTQIEYEQRKPHLGYPKQTIFFHKTGEETGEKPTLYSDGKGGLLIRGGNYSITPEGLRN